MNISQLLEALKDPSASISIGEKLFSRSLCSDSFNGSGFYSFSYNISYNKNTASR
ncbi:hypothetical protein Q5M85_22330 [Paraclostridium bifermentans]|nr:hypothetical protein [Paraclostridium bifermentans]